MKSAALGAYYRTELLYAQVLEILHLDGSSDADDPVGAKAIKIARLLLTVGQVDRMQSGKGDDATSATTGEPAGGVLGVSPSLLRRTTGLADERIAQFHSDTARHALLPRVEAELREKGDDVCDIMLPELMDRKQSWSASSAVSAFESVNARQVLELPALIMELQSLKVQKANDAGVVKRQLHTQLRGDLERIKAMIQTIQRILVHYKQHDQPRVLETKLQWLAAYSRAMSVRARVLTRQVLVETYSAERVAVLAGVHEALQDRRRQALEEREQLLTKLHLYRNADPEFQAIAQQYASVLQSIDQKKKWIQSLDM